MAKHGDGVRDIAFSVDDCKGLHDKAVKRGGKSVLAPTELKDSDGVVLKATIQTYGDTVHSFVQRDQYKGPYLPGYVLLSQVPGALVDDPVLKMLPMVQVEFIDHCVGNQPDLEMNPVCQWHVL